MLSGNTPSSSLVVSQLSLLVADVSLEAEAEVEVETKADFLAASAL